MKILFETDPHFKELGSLSNESRFNPKYSTRLDLMIKSFEWLYIRARELNVDMIIHGGDILDKPSISAKESHAIQEAFSYNTTGIKEYVLVGNHDRKDEHTHALAILSNYPSITVVNSPIKVDNIALLPFTTNIDYNVIKELSCDVLFSHVDILGTELAPNIYSTKGFDPEILKDYFKTVLNGHIHTPGIYGIVYNVGSFFGSGLGDNYSERYPSCYYIDTETSEMTGTINPYSIHYETILSNDLIEIKKNIERLISLDYSFYLRIQCLNEVKSEVRLLVNKYLENNQKILSAIIVGLSRNKNQNLTSEKKQIIQTSSNPIEILLGFIKTVEEKKLPASKSEVEAMVLENYRVGGTE